MSKADKKDTLFIGNLIPDITEDMVRVFFSSYGRVMNTVIPRDKGSGRPKNYGFIQFSTEEEALSIYEKCQHIPPRISDIPVAVSWAYANKIEIKSSPKHLQKRSRSPKRFSDWRPKSDRRMEQLSREKWSLQEETAKLEKKLNDYKTMNDELRAELSTLKSQGSFTLPCGHTKPMIPKDKYLFNDLFREAVSILNPKDQNNENIVNQVKARLYLIVEKKSPEIYRCKQKEKIILGNCGHIAEVECWVIRKHQQSKTLPMCNEVVEKMLPCGHIQQVTCHNQNDHLICKDC